MVIYILIGILGISIIILALALSKGKTESREFHKSLKESLEDNIDTIQQLQESSTNELRYSLTEGLKKIHVTVDDAIADTERKIQANNDAVSESFNESKRLINDQYTEDERVRYESGEKKGKLRMYKKGEFIYRLAGREREKSASYYTPEVLTKCLVKYALKELLEGKTADEILELTICEPAMGSAAFLNEAINQLAETYITRKEQETGEVIGYENRFNELQKVKMYIADRNVYGIDLNPVAVELAEVSLWLNTIHEGGYVPWFGTQLVNGNSLIGARRQCYRAGQLTTKTKGLHWYENAPERVPLGTKRQFEGKGIKASARQIYHFLLGDPGMCSYNDKVIKSLEPGNIKKMKEWNKQFNKEYTESEIATLLRLSKVIDELWEEQVKLRKEIEQKTQDNISVFGRKDNTEDSHTTIRQKDKILSELYKSEHMRNVLYFKDGDFFMDPEKKKCVLKLSKKQIDEISSLEKKGFEIYRAEVRNLVYWQGRNEENEVLIVLPNIYLRRHIHE